jgi:hypothetical protein
MLGRLSRACQGISGGLTSSRHQYEYPTKESWFVPYYTLSHSSCSLDGVKRNPGLLGRDAYLPVLAGDILSLRRFAFATLHSGYSPDDHPSRSHRTWLLRFRLNVSST